MFKSLFAAAAALSMSAGAAVAGPYVNVETNASCFGDDYVGALTDLHVGFEGEVGAAAWYVQGGPLFSLLTVLRTRPVTLVRLVLVSL